MRRRTTAIVAAATLAVPAAVLMAPSAFAVPQATLPGSTFQIDEDANLKVDTPTAQDPETVDWASLAHATATDPEKRATDKPTGQNDDSYKGGVKEDDSCPGEVTGSIPNNKSDLLTFHFNEEAATAGNKGFLNLAWSRVSDPSGTTLMDFEFNQSTTKCSTGPNVLRTGDGAGPLKDDLLIEYAIDQGGSRATITKRDWGGSAWGPAVTLSTNSPVCGNAPCAVGTINQTTIPGNESDGLVPNNQSKSPRTFGEAQIDLRLLFDSGKCTSFGSAMIKSRSSDAFTSQLKDFISPIPIDLKNCGTVIIRKQTDPDENPNTTSFNYTKAFATDPSTANTFSLTDDGVQTYSGNVLFGSNFTVTEDLPLPAGWTFVSLDCSASSSGVPAGDRVVAGRTVTFTIDDEDDVLDCTYTNESKGAIKVTKTRKHAASGAGDHPQAGVDFTVKKAGVTVGTVTTGADGTACIENLTLGDYTVTETVPAGYAAEGDVTKNVTVTSGTCASTPTPVAFKNLPLTDLTVSVSSQITGGTNSQITCTGLSPTPADATPSAFDDTSETVKDLVPGTYTCTVVIDP